MSSQCAAASLVFGSIGALCASEAGQEHAASSERPQQPGHRHRHSVGRSAAASEGGILPGSKQIKSDAGEVVVLIAWSWVCLWRWIEVSRRSGSGKARSRTMRHRASSRLLIAGGTRIESAPANLSCPGKMRRKGSQLSAAVRHIYLSQQNLFSSHHYISVHIRSYDLCFLHAYSISQTNQKYLLTHKHPPSL